MLGTIVYDSGKSRRGKVSLCYRIRIAHSLLCAIFLIYAATAHAGWKEEVIQKSIDFRLNTNSTVTVNSVPHIFYTGRYLYHSYYVNNEWVTEEIDDRLAFVGRDEQAGDGGVAATVDTSNRIHLIYGARAGKLKYAVFSDSKWTISETPLRASRLGGMNVGDLVVDASGHVHVFYKATDASSILPETTAYISHAVYDGTSWVQSSIDDTPSSSCGFVCNKLSAEIGQYDGIHVLYSAGSLGDVKFIYQKYANGVWTKEYITPVDQDGVNLAFSELVMTASGDPLVCYLKATSAGSGMFCAENSSGEWLPENVVVEGSPFVRCYFSTELVRSVDGEIHGVRECIEDITLDHYLEYVVYKDGVWSAGLNAIYSNNPLVFFLIAYADSSPFVFYMNTPGGVALHVSHFSKDGSELISDLVASTNPGPKGYFPYALFDDADVLHVTHDANVYSARTYDGWNNTVLGMGYTAVNALPFSIMADGSMNVFYTAVLPMESRHLRLDAAGEIVTDGFIDNKYQTNEQPVSLIDVKGDAHLMFLDVPTWSIYSATNSGGSWIVEKVYEIGYTDIEKEKFNSWYRDGLVKYALNFSMNSDGDITAAFVEWHYDATDIFEISARLIKLSQKSGIWGSDLIDEQSPDVWLSPSIQVDSTASIHMSYTAILCNVNMCIPDGIEYGTDRSGTWVTSKISSETYLYENPEHPYLDPYYMTAQISDLSISRNDDVFISYIYGAQNVAAEGVPDIVSEIRVVSVDGCMPVSRVIYDELIFGRITSLDPEEAYMKSVVNSAGLGAVVFHDKANMEPHVLLQEPGLRLSACVNSVDGFELKINNDGASGVFLNSVALVAYSDSLYEVLSNTCVDSYLAGGDSCGVQIRASLPLFDSSDLLYSAVYVDNTDTTLYVGVQSDNNDNKTVYTVDTSALRPAAVVIDESIDASGVSNGGSVNFESIICLLVWYAVFGCRGNSYYAVNKRLLAGMVRMIRYWQSYDV